MTDINIIINNLITARKLAWNGESCNIMDDDDALTVKYAISDAIEFLKEQQPVKPVKMDLCNGEPFCPTCGSTVKCYYNFCVECGQKFRKDSKEHAIFDGER